LIDSPKKSVMEAGNALMAALLPIARTMIKSGFGVGELVQAAKLSYVQAAIREVIPPGGKLNVSRLSVATGLTRKEIAALLVGNTGKSPAISPRRIMEQRAFRVLQGWSIDPFFQKSDGRPADLEFRTGQHTFSLLVRRYAGDVTPVTVLRELERMKAVVAVKSGKLRLRPRALDSRTHAAHQMAELARLLRNFAETAQQIVIPRERPVFFGFRDSNVGSANQAALFQRVFSQRAAALLEGMDQWLAKNGGSRAGKKGASKLTRRQESAVRIGLGVYLVQDD
jgi:hypothetical protein